MKITSDPTMKYSREEQRQKILKKRSGLDQITNVLESDCSDVDKEGNSKKVDRFERKLKPIKLFKPKNVQFFNGLGEEEQNVDAPPTFIDSGITAKISQNIKKMRLEQAEKKKQQKLMTKKNSKVSKGVKGKDQQEGNVQDDEDDDDDEYQDDEQSQDSAYDNYYGRIAETRKRQGRQQLDFDNNEQFEDDQEQDQLFMIDDQYDRDETGGVIEGGKGTKNKKKFSLKARKIISKYQNEKNQEDEQQEHGSHEDDSSDSDLFSDYDQQDQIDTKVKSNNIGNKSSSNNHNNERATTEKQKLTEHLLLEELRKGARFYMKDFCTRIQKRYFIENDSEFSRMVKKLAHLDSDKWLILKEQFRPTYSKSTLLLEPNAL